MQPGTKGHFWDLFLSTNKVPISSVTEYYKEVSADLVTIIGAIEGPFRLPYNTAYHALHGYGI